MTVPSKILLGRGSPRSNIREVESLNESLPCDKLIVRFVGEYKAYMIMKDEFMKRPDYTHLVLATDDIVVKPEHIVQLQKDLDEFDYPVISGMMNVDQDDDVHVNLTWELPIKDRKHRQYNNIRREMIADEPDIFQVAFSGFPLMAIRRDIVKPYIFAADKVFQGFPPYRGASLDLVFCWYCKENNIPVMVDKRIDMKHLRASGTNRVGKKHTKVEYWHDGIIEQISRAELR